MEQIYPLIGELLCCELLSHISQVTKNALRSVYLMNKIKKMISICKSQKFNYHMVPQWNSLRLR